MKNYFKKNFYGALLILGVLASLLTYALIEGYFGRKLVYGLMLGTGLISIYIVYLIRYKKKEKEKRDKK
jgi:hypothetical protein